MGICDMSQEGLNARDLDQGGGALKHAAESRAAGLVDMAEILFGGISN